ncbi:MAG: RNA polymerase sigma factor [Chloroflexota bacterium]
MTLANTQTTNSQTTTNQTTISQANAPEVLLSGVQCPDQRDERYRENHEWLATLKGEMGHVAQQKAHEALAAYLFAAVQNFLLQRQSEYVWLSALAYPELATLAEDFVQNCLEKLSRNEYALLEQFAGIGSFTSWTAQIALNEARTELRRVCWSRQQPLEGISSWAEAHTPNPDRLLQQQFLATTLGDCLNQLPESHRTVLVRCVMHGERAKDVAKDLDRSSQAVYNLINRAKKELALLLAEADVNVDDLGVFVG